MKKTSTARIALAALLLAPLAAQAQQPIADFVKRPTYGTAKISPDGEYLAITVDHGEQDVLTVLDAATLKPLKVNVLPDRKSVGAFWNSLAATSAAVAVRRAK